MSQSQIFCRCLEGYCFLGKDAEWAKKNYAQALRPNQFFVDLLLLSTLDDERLQVKNEWMNSLGVSGIVQVSCRHQVSSGHQVRCEHQSVADTSQKNFDERI